MGGPFNTTKVHQYLLYHHKCHTLHNASQTLEHIIVHNMDRQMSGASVTASLGYIMLISIQKVVETPGTMLGAVQLGFSCPLEIISRINFTHLHWFNSFPSRVNFYSTHVVQKKKCCALQENVVSKNLHSKTRKQLINVLLTAKC